MKRMKKMYSIKESTVKTIKQEANKIAMPESYALDNIVEEWKRLKDYIKQKNIDHEKIENQPTVDKTEQLVESKEETVIEQDQEKAKTIKVIKELGEKWTTKK